MDKISANHEFKQILNAIAKYDSGVTKAILLAELTPAIPNRTLQRRLHQLKDKNLIFSLGHGRATRYYAIEKNKGLIDLTAEGYIKITPEGEAIRKQISKPLRARKPVTYNANFLEDYVPNQTFYLTPNIRHELRELGEEQGEQHIAGTFAKKILAKLRIDLSWNSSRLEGNTYSLLDTEQLIHRGIEAEGKNLFETRMILNHKAAIEFLVEQGENLEFNRYIILNLHALLSKNLLGDPGASGRLRTQAVGIANTSYQPLEISQLIVEKFNKILDMANCIEDPFEQSFFSMVHLPYLQPFIDVNKRVSRLAANIPLFKHNLCPISFVDVPKQAYIDGLIGIYELNQIDLLSDVYIWAYERSTLRYSETQSYLREPDIFLERYDKQIRNLVRDIIQSNMSRKEANRAISLWLAENNSDIDGERFIEMVQTQLLSVHEGNIANYKVLQHEFISWKKNWDA